MGQAILAQHRFEGVDLCRNVHADILQQGVVQLSVGFVQRVQDGSDITPDLAKLKGKRIGVLQGTTQETYGNEHWAPKGIEIVSYQGQDNIYSDLTAGRIDAAFQDEVAASEGFLKQPVGKDYQFGGPSIKDEKLFGVGTGMGLRKEDNELREALNKAFADMRKDGTYDKLAKKYFDFNVYGD